MSDTKVYPRALALSLAYFVCEMGFDAFAVWILFSRDHPWLALTWAILAGFSANINVKRYSGASS